MTEPGKFKERYNSSREFRMTVNIITGSGLLILTLLICYSFVLHVLPAAMEGGARLLPVQTPDKMDIIDSEDS